MFLYSANGETCGTGPDRQQGILQACRECSSPIATFHLYRRRHVLSRRPAPAPRRQPGRGVHFARRRPAILRAERARDWELQMMIKARVAAGDQRHGRRASGFRRAPDLFHHPRLLGDRRAFRHARAHEREACRRGSARHKRPQGHSAIDVKLERGGIRDIEFLVQCLQRLYGGADPWVRHGGTMLALARLQDKGYLSGAEYGRLASAYQFLRHLEHRLAVRRRSPDAHPAGATGSALELLARRMPGGRRLGGMAAAIKPRACTSQQVIGDLRSRGACRLGRQRLRRGGRTGASGQRRARAGTARSAAGGSASREARFASRLQSLRTFSGAHFDGSGTPGALECRIPILPRARPGSVRAQPVLRRRTDSHA